VAFIIETYSEKELPSKLILENTTGLLSAFKPNQYYVLVLAVFTKTKVLKCGKLDFFVVTFPFELYIGKLFAIFTQPTFSSTFHIEYVCISHNNSSFLFLNNTDNTMYMYASWHAKETAIGQVSKLILWVIGLVAFCAVTVTVTCVGTVYLLQKRGYKM